MYILTLLYYYLGSLRVIFSLYYLAGFALIFRKKNIKINHFITILFIFFYFLIKYYQSGSLIASFLYIRLYWGFLFLYFLFKKFELKNPVIFFTSCAFITIIEYFAIRLNFSLTDVLSNYDGTFTADWKTVSIKFYGGVHSFGGSRAVSGSLLLAAFIFFDTRKEFYNPKIKYLMLTASILCFSATSFILTIIYLFRKFYKKKIFILFLIFACLSIIYLQDIWNKISFNNISFIFYYKLDQILDNFKYLTDDLLSFLFGTSKVLSESLEVANYGMLIGDFSFFDFLLRNGFIGMFFFIYFVYNNFNKNNSLIIIFLLISSLHYHVIFSFPGQIFFAYFLNIKDFNLYKNGKI